MPIVAQAQATYPFEASSGDVRIYLETINDTAGAGLKVSCPSTTSPGNCNVTTTSTLATGFDNAAIWIADFLVYDDNKATHPISRVRVAVENLAYNPSTGVATWDALLDFMEDTTASGIPYTWTLNAGIILWNNATDVEVSTQETFQCSGDNTSGCTDAKIFNTSDIQPAGTTFVAWLPQDLVWRVDSAGDKLDLETLAFELGDAVVRPGVPAIMDAEASCEMTGSVVGGGGPVDVECTQRVRALSASSLELKRQTIAVEDQTGFGNGFRAARYIKELTGTTPEGFFPVMAGGGFELGSAAEVSQLEMGCTAARIEVSSSELSALSSAYDEVNCGGMGQPICYSDAQLYSIDGPNHDFVCSGNCESMTSYDAYFSVLPASRVGADGEVTCIEVDVE